MWQGGAGAPPAVPPAAAPQLLFGPALDLADPLATEAQLLPDLLQRPRLLPVKAEAHADHVALPGFELVHHRLDPLLEGGADHLDLRRGDGVLLQRVAQLEAAILPHPGRERDV